MKKTAKKSASKSKVKATIPTDKAPKGQNSDRKVQVYLSTWTEDYDINYNEVYLCAVEGKLTPKKALKALQEARKRNEKRHDELQEEIQDLDLEWQDIFNAQEEIERLGLPKVSS